MAGRPAFRILAWDLAVVSDLSEFHVAGMHGAKGGNWAMGMPVLDVGAGISHLAAHLAERLHMDAEVADDFGAEAGGRRT